MTAHANSLTERVMPAQGSAWSMPANDARAFVRALGSLGHDVETLLTAAGLDESHLNDPDSRLPCEAIGAIVACAQQRRFTPNLPLAVAQATPLGAYPLLDYLVLTSDTVGAGIRQLARYLRLIANPTVLTFREGQDPIRVEIASTSPFSVELTASLMVLHFRHETNGAFAPLLVTLQHRPDDVAEYERILGCPVESPAASNQISITAETWRVPLRRRDPVLRQLLETQANTILERRPARNGFAGEVQRALTENAAGSGTRIQAIARRLAMSARTLQRRLAIEGLSFQELREDARKEVAGYYIAESTLAICEVAYLVGYSEPAPFHRAFKRWYGMTPDVFRRKRREGASSPPAA